MYSIQLLSANNKTAPETVRKVHDYIYVYRHRRTEGYKIHSYTHPLACTVQALQSHSKHCASISASCRHAAELTFQRSSVESSDDWQMLMGMNRGHAHAELGGMGRCWQLSKLAHLIGCYGPLAVKLHGEV